MMQPQLRPDPKRTWRFSSAVHRRIPFLVSALALFLGQAIARADDAVQPKLERRTFFVTRSLGHERLIPFLKQARPEIVQIGNYGAMFHGYADNEKSTGWPMQLPVAGERAALEYQRDLNDKVHQLGLTVVGHFRLIKVMGNWSEKSGFVEYYNDRWPRELLGAKPHPEVAELLQRDASGKPIQLGRYNQSQLALCLSSPHAREVLKRMLKVAIEHGVDGVNTNFNYHFGCVCPYCQSAFKQWLRKNYSPEVLQAKLGIKDFHAHVFKTIGANIPGFPDETKASELDWLAVRWGAVHFKEKFDEIFNAYGRSLKKDLLVAQWNHLGHVGIREERAFLPLKMWGRDEDYFWYSGGASFVGKNLNLSEGKAGDAWLSCLYVRELSGGKPFVMGKYDRTRLAASMAEGYATGGLGMGRYMRFEDPVGFQVLAAYIRFMHKHRQLYQGAESFADVALVLPRQSVWNRRPESLDAFRSLGQQLVEKQVLLDVLADERITRERLARYRVIIVPEMAAISDDQLAALQDYAASGGLLLVQGEFASMDEQGRKRKNDPEIKHEVIADHGDAPSAAATIKSTCAKNGGTHIDAPWTVRAAAYQQANRLLLHLVNYDREQGASEDNRSGPAEERPKPVNNIKVRLRAPNSTSPLSVRIHTPDAQEATSIPFQSNDGYITFSVPRLRVYGVVEINLK